jgi:hypothetical protein
MVSQKPTAFPTRVNTNSGEFHQASTTIDGTLRTSRVINPRKMTTPTVGFVLEVLAQTRRRQLQISDVTDANTSDS